jgi:hypothetical protein
MCFNSFIGILSDILQCNQLVPNLQTISYHLPPNKSNEAGWSKLAPQNRIAAPKCAE